jgi:hypothetical protein
VVSWLCWNRLYSSCDYYFSWRGRLRVINKFLSVVLFSSSGVLMAWHTFFIYFGVIIPLNCWTVGCYERWKILSNNALNCLQIVCWFAMCFISVQFPVEVRWMWQMT